MAPTGSRLAMILVNLHRIEWAGRRKRSAIILKVNLKLGKTKRVDQYFGRQNDPMSRPTLGLTPLGMNTTNRTTSPIDSVPVGTENTEPTPLTRPIELPEQNGKSHVPGDPDPEPSLLDSLSKKSNFSNDSNSSK